MVKIILEPAKNGIIKRIIDDNHGGAKEQWASTDVYEVSAGGNKLNYIMKFFFDLCEDLGVDLGSKFDKEVITIRKEWGSHFEANYEDLELKIKEIEAQLQLLKECQKP